MYVHPYNQNPNLKFPEFAIDKSFFFFFLNMTQRFPFCPYFGGEVSMSVLISSCSSSLIEFFLG